MHHAHVEQEPDLVDISALVHTVGRLCNSICVQELFQLQHIRWHLFAGVQANALICDLLGGHDD